MPPATSRRQRRCGMRPARLLTRATPTNATARPSLPAPAPPGATPRPPLRACLRTPPGPSHASPRRPSAGFHPLLPLCDRVFTTGWVSAFMGVPTLAGPCLHRVLRCTEVAGVVGFDENLCRSVAGGATVPSSRRTQPCAHHALPCPATSPREPFRCRVAIRASCAQPAARHLSQAIRYAARFPNAADPILRPKKLSAHRTNGSARRQTSEPSRIHRAGWDFPGGVTRPTRALHLIPLPNMGRR